MSPTLILSLVAGYFVVLIIIALLTLAWGLRAKAFSWPIATRRRYMVAFAMIGTSLSGVTFISVPGNVQGKSWSYLAVALGFVAGYLVIGTVLLPLYYRLRLVSIYSYLEQRFGYWSYKTGALFFLISRSLGLGVAAVPGGGRAAAGCVRLDGRAVLRYGAGQRLLHLSLYL